MSTLVAAEPLEQTTDKKVHWLDDFKRDEMLFSFEGYRLLRYRSPTPEAHEDVPTLTTNALQALLARSKKPVLLNVQPLRWSQGLFLESEPFYHIAGSRWIPNVGMGELTDGWQDYFDYHLKAATKDKPDYPVVIYCRADCWMSWNAVKRAARQGYTRLYWYKNGVDGWQEAGLPLVRATPEPYPVRNR